MLVKCDRGQMGSMGAGGAAELLLSRGSVSSATPWGSVVDNLPASAGETGDVGSIPGLGRSLGEGNSNPLKYSCLGNPMDRGAWRATVRGVAESGTQLSACARDTVCAVHAPIPLSSRQPNKGTAIVIPTLQMRKLKPKVAK